jgi:midasin
MLLFLHPFVSGKAFEFKEPVLLVGETGCGKTTVCQMLAAIHQQSLYTVNCHMHTESSDFLGGLRPVRDHANVSVLYGGFL